MRHCILMTAYKDANLINEIISNVPNDWGCYIHLDKKCSINENDINNKANVFKQFKVYWGGVEHLKAFLFLLDKAYNDGKNYDYYHLITGQDYFAVPANDFDNVLGHDGLNYLDCFKLPRENWWGGGFDIIKIRTLASFVDSRKKVWKIFNMILKWSQSAFHLCRQIPPYPMYGGSVYCSITKEAAHEVLFSDLSKDLLYRLTNTTCGEEVFFQTVLMNSNLKDTIINTNLRYIDWSVPHPPKVLLEDDYNNIVRSKSLFCRKIDSKKSAKLLIKLREFINVH